MPTDSVSRSVPVLGRATFPSAVANFSTALLRPTTYSTSSRCSFVSRSQREAARRRAPS